MANNVQKKRRARDPRGTILRLLAYVVKGYGWPIFMVLVCILAVVYSQVRGALFIQTLIDEYVMPLIGTAAPDYGPLLQAILVMSAIYALGVVASVIYNRLMVTVALGVQRQVRNEMFDRMQLLPVGFFDTHSHGNLMSHYTNDVDTLRQMLSQSIPIIVSSSLSMAGVFMGMVTVSVPLTLVVLGFVLIMAATAGKITKSSGAFFGRQQKDLGAVNGYIEEMMNGQKVVKVFSHEGASKEDFDVLNDSLWQAARQANKYANVLMPIMANLGYLLYVIVAVVGGYMAKYGVGMLTIGGIATFLQLSRSFTMPISQIALQLNSIVMALAGAERIFDLMDGKPEVDEGSIELVNARFDEGILVETRSRTGVWAWKDGDSLTQVRGDVVLNHVDFSYHPAKQILFDVSVYARPGDKVAFVGTTGAGKTTITNLINRFYEIQEGEILYDGIDVTRIKKADLRRSLGVVLQETHLFTGTIKENISYGNLTASDEEVERAARLANAHDFISRLPEGYDTVLRDNGEALSQGQQQLLNIARAAIADPPVIILDEATSSIDTRTETIVQNGLDALMKGRTVFVIAHRLSTIKNADVIMVMDQGQIIERGNHQALIAQGQRYFQLYTGAFELE